MYKNADEAAAFAEEFKKLYHDTDIRVAICAPFPQLETLVKAFKGTGIGVGAQNVHFEKEGAYTGEVSVPMLQYIGVDYCIVGHSERRQYFNETDKSVNLKLKALLETEITPILCVGEDLSQREAGHQDRLVEEQVQNALKDIPAEKAEKIVIAYEPVWAVGTGTTPTAKEIEKAANAIRKVIADDFSVEAGEKINVVYGGSLNEKNIALVSKISLLDGVLIGNSALKCENLVKMAKALPVKAG